MNRRSFIKSGIILSTLSQSNKLEAFVKSTKDWSEVDRPMPVLFVGHGAPLYALDENKYSLAWRKIGSDIPTPKAIVCISAHWLTRGSTRVTAMPKPRTIHDFGRMDDRLFEMQYPAPGSPELAKDIADSIQSTHIELDHEWGFDHGTWCVLHHMFPKADIPVIQFSIDYREDAEYHFNLAKQLSYLRKKGIFIIASGNIVHNLREIVFQEEAAFDYAIEFDEISKNLMEKGDFKSLMNYNKLGQAANRSIPTPDHYFPLMYSLGLKTEKDELSFPIEGISYGSTSMRSVLISSSD